MTTKTTVSGGFNPPHYQKYPGLAAYRMALKMNEEQFEKYIKKLLGAAAVEEVGRQEKEAAMKKQYAELQKFMAFLKKTYPKQYSEVMEAKRFKSLTARPYTAREAIDSRDKRWKSGLK